MAEISRLTARRLSYASGYLGLGLCKEAAGELKAIRGEERKTAAFLAVQSELLLATKQWEPLVRVAEEQVLRQCTEPTAWINWAYALRELERVEEAKTVLLQAEPLHPNEGVLHYNLACYYCLLGEMKEAKRRLAQACKLDKSWKEAAESDPDLRRLRSDRGQMTEDGSG